MPEHSNKGVRVNKEKIERTKKLYGLWRLKNRERFKLLSKADIKELWKREMIKRAKLSKSLKANHKKRAIQKERVRGLSEKFSVYKNKEDYGTFIKDAN